MLIGQTQGSSVRECGHTINADAPKNTLSRSSAKLRPRLQNLNQAASQVLIGAWRYLIQAVSKDVVHIALGEAQGFDLSCCEFIRRVQYFADWKSKPSLQEFTTRLDLTDLAELLGLEKTLSEELGRLILVAVACRQIRLTDDFSRPSAGEDGVHHTTRMNKSGSGLATTLTVEQQLMSGPEAGSVAEQLGGPAPPLDLCRPTQEQTRQARGPSSSGPLLQMLLASRRPYRNSKRLPKPLGSPRPKH
jgi:hypothetical protein